MPPAKFRWPMTLLRKTMPCKSCEAWLRPQSQRICSCIFLSNSAELHSFPQGGGENIMLRASLSSPGASSCLFNLRFAFLYLGNENNYIYASKISGTCVCVCARTKWDKVCKAFCKWKMLLHVNYYSMTSLDLEYALLNKVSLSLEQFRCRMSYQGKIVLYYIEVFFMFIYLPYSNIKIQVGCFLRCCKPSFIFYSLSWFQFVCFGFPLR